jgi:hypothetical protein
MNSSTTCSSCIVAGRGTKTSRRGPVSSLLLLVNSAILAAVLFQIWRFESGRDLIDGHLAELERIEEQLARLQGPELQAQAPAQQDSETTDTLGDLRSDIRELRSDFVVLEAQIQELLFKQQGATPR